MLDLLLCNTCFKKRDNHLITYESGGNATQIDFILFHKSMRKLVTDVKVIPGEEVATQHQLLVCDMQIKAPPKKKHTFIPRLKIWKLKDPETSSRFQDMFKARMSASTTAGNPAIEELWSSLKTCHLLAVL